LKTPWNNDVSFVVEMGKWQSIDRNTRTSMKCYLSTLCFLLLSFYDLKFYIFKIVR
jgi:hypothetical protein